MTEKRKFNIVCIGSGEMFQYCVRTILGDPENQVSAIFTWAERVTRRISRYVPLDRFSQEVGIRLWKVETINAPQVIQSLKELKPDLVFVDGWSEKLAPEVLQVAPNKFVCIHPSLLPNARGGATLNWALINAEKEWGVTLFYMTNKIDQGDIIAQEQFSLEERDDIQTAFEKATVAAIELLRKTIPLLRSSKAKRQPQNHKQATFLRRRKPEEGNIKWTCSSKDIYNLIRALTRPYPGAFFYLGNKKIFVWKAYFERKHSDDGGWENETSSVTPGQVCRILAGLGIWVSCGQNSKLLIERVQSQGEPPMWADEWCYRNKIQEGFVFEGNLETPALERLSTQ